MDGTLEWITVRYRGVDYNRYKISEYGTVWDLKKDNEVSTSVNLAGQTTYVNIVPDSGERSGRKRIRIINLLCNSFHGDAPDKEYRPYCAGEIHKSKIHWVHKFSILSDENFICENVGIFRCRKCSTIYRGYKIDGGCPCSEIPDGTPCAVYVLAEDSGVGLKIGKSVNPFLRQYTINQSANTVGYSFPQVDRVVWVSGENCAFTLEKILHRRFKKEKLKLKKFDGSNEVFDIQLSDVDNYLQEIQNILERLRLGEDLIPEKPPIYPQSKIDYSVECGGYWYPSTKWVADRYMLDLKNLKEQIRKGKTLTEVLHRILDKRAGVYVHQSKNFNRTENFEAFKRYHHMKTNTPTDTEIAFLWRDKFFKTKPLNSRIFPRSVQDGMYWYPTELEFFKEYNIPATSNNITSFKEATCSDKVVSLPYDYCAYKTPSEAL